MSRNGGDGGRPNPAPERSLVEDMHGVVNDARQMLTDFGLRPYRVFSVKVRWTGGAVGRGEPVVIEEREFLPTPEVSVRPVRRDLRAGGAVERGRTTLRQINPDLTEDEIRGLCHCGAQHATGVQGFVEVRIDERDGSTVRRRFTVASAPAREAGAFQWVVDLEKQDENRTRAGAVPNV